MLCMRVKGKTMPWVAQIISDLGILRRHANAKGMSAPSCEADVDSWSALYNSSTDWDAMVGSIFFTECASDAKSNAESQIGAMQNFICMQCPPYH